MGNPVIPLMTVVVPTYGRPELVEELLKSIRQVEDADAVAVDIIIIDSSCPPDRQMIQTACEKYRAELLDGPASVSSKRNIGATRARAPIVLFADSDCRLEPGCLSAHINALSNPDVAFSVGSLTFVGWRSVWFRAVEASGILAAFSPPEGEDLPWGPTANLAVRRNVIMTMGFDPEFGPPGFGGEDVDFGLRLTDGGYRGVGTPAARAVHSTETWNHPMEMISRFMSWGRADAMLVRRHPERSYLDLPSPVLASALILAVTLMGAVFSPARLLAIPIAMITGIAIIAFERRGAADRLVFVLAPMVFILLDLGRVMESVRRGWWGAALKRLRFCKGEAEAEWPDLVITMRAVILALLMTLTVLWGLPL